MCLTLETWLWCNFESFAATGHGNWRPVRFGLCIICQCVHIWHIRGSVWVNYISQPITEGFILFTLYVLNIATKLETCIYNFYRSSSLTLHRCLKSFLMQDKHLLILHSQYHGCWWPGDTRSQGVNNHVSDLGKSGNLGPRTWRVNLHGMAFSIGSSELVYHQRALTTTIPSSWFAA